MEIKRKETITLMGRYYEYSQKLMPKITDQRDKNELEAAISIMQEIFNANYFLQERAIFGNNPDQVIIQDLEEHIGDWKKEMKKCKSMARRCKFAGYYNNLLILPHRGDRLLAKAEEYQKMTQDYTQAIKTTQATIASIKIRMKESVAQQDLVTRILSGNELEVEKRQFENYLREHLINATSIEIKNYREHPDQLIFDSILTLREKYDPRGVF